MYLGIILLAGYFFSVLAEKAGLPKIVGYLAAGLLLNPEITNFIPTEFSGNADTITTFCLAFITFEIGSNFSVSDLRSSGKKYFKLAAFESLGAFILIFLIFFFLSSFLVFSNLGTTETVAFSLLLAALAAPTDPSATLAVIHEYKASGPVTKSILGAAAFDDIITLVLFSFGFSISRTILGGGELSALNISYTILYKIIGAVALGTTMGFVFNKTISILRISVRNPMLVIFLGFLSLTFGLAIFLELDEMFSTLTLGFIVRNFNNQKDKIISITRDDLEELFFLIFFIFSAIHFNFSSSGLMVLILISIFIALRAGGKYMGMFIGTRYLKMPDKVKKYAFGGLIPQGGIVLGLALLIGAEPLFKEFSNILSGIIMGATIIHEFAGPLLSKYVLKKSGEINI
jgi:NhaP-type Na+/H+ or K+/H+ antiporter